MTIRPREEGLPCLRLPLLASWHCGGMKTRPGTALGGGVQAGVRVLWGTCQMPTWKVTRDSMGTMGSRRGTRIGVVTLPGQHRGGGQDDKPRGAGTLCLTSHLPSGATPRVSSRAPFPIWALSSLTW